MAEFEAIACDNGAFSVRETSSNQAMHSRIGPWQEAHEIYVGPSRLAERLKTGSNLTLHDVGLGIATNALAAIQCRKSLKGTTSKLHIVSYETRPEGLRYAFSQWRQDTSLFPWMTEHAESVAAILDQGHWEDEQVCWELRSDYFKGEHPPADLIFYDFYSPSSSPALWQQSAFQQIREHSPMALLVTYSSATQVRLNLLGAGFYVGQGASTAAKRETTLASASASLVTAPLDLLWLERKKQALDAHAASAGIQVHPQFAHAIFPGR
jgi:tRNA U34 5-methylaminomethyl-2-thiouridine-forming methyltransferase MnmC